MVLIAVAGVFAVLNWLAVERDDDWLEFIAKPATTALLALAAIAITPADPTQRAWFVAALVFCLAGDIFLMLPQNLFVPGLASFLVGHVLFIVGMIEHGIDVDPIAGVYIAVMGVLAWPVLTSVRERHADLFAPVAVYIAVIGTMLVTALSGDSLVGAAGGLLFVTSDRVLAHNRFIKPFPHAQLAIMTTYHAALFLLVLSLR